MALLAYFSFPTFRFGVILDPWMFSLKEKLDLPNTVRQPLLFVNTETFHISTNFQALKKYTDITPDGCGKRTVFTIKYVYRCHSLQLPHILHNKCRCAYKIVCMKVSKILKEILVL
jgi:hypothetical protein